MIIKFSCIFLCFAMALSNIMLTKVQQNVTLSILNELMIFNLVIVTPPEFTVNKNATSLVNFFSKFNVYVSYLTISQLNSFIYHYNNKAKDDNEPFHYQKSMILLYYIDPEYGLYLGMSNTPYNISRFTWLIWPDDNNFTGEGCRYEDEEFFKMKIVDHIPYNAQVLVPENHFKEKFKIVEVFRQDIFSSLSRVDFGTWSDRKGLEVLEKDFYKRRSDVNGTYLKVIDYDFAEPFIYDMYKDIVAEIARFINFKVHYISNEMWWKRYKETNEAILWDIVLRPTWVTTYQNNAPLGLLRSSKGYLYIKHDSKYEDHRLIYFQPFPKPVWLMILAAILTSGILTAIMLTKFLKGRCKDFDVLSGMYLAVEAFTNQCGFCIPENSSIRIIIITVRMFAVSSFMLFSALILDCILSPEIKLPFTDIKGLVEDGTYKIAVPLNTDLDEWFKKSSDSLMRMVPEKYFLPQDERAENFFRQLNNFCKTQNIFYIFFGGALSYTDCEFLRIPVPVTRAWHGVPLNYESPYSVILNRKFMQVFDAGFFYKFDGHFMSIENLLELMKLYRSHQTKPVEIEIIAPIFLMLGTLYIFSLFLLLFEILFNKKRGNALKCKGFPRHHIRLNQLRLITAQFDNFS